MIIKREEEWGIIKYDTVQHQFDYTQNKKLNEVPYVGRPIVLNCDLTLDCNMRCKYCVARDMLKYCRKDLNVTSDLISKINDSPFMVVVVTGGEPLLPKCEKSLLQLVSGLRKKGIVVDTNGCIDPSVKVMKCLAAKKVLVRVSLDSLRFADEVSLRMKGPQKSNHEHALNKEAYMQKIDLIPKLQAFGIHVAIQSVLHKKNSASIKEIPKKLKEWSIDKWFVQRLIPTQGLVKDQHYAMFHLDNKAYESTLNSIEAASREYGITCFTKRDRRHNCVFLMVGEGEIYTQSDKSGVKVPIGRIGEEKREYFAYVSNADHSLRYYGIKPATSGERI